MTTNPETLPETSLVASMDAIRLYADIAEDYNPLHLDPAFAARTEMGGCIAHGTMSLSLIWQSLAAAVPGALADAALEIRFVRPVRVDDRVTAGGRRRPEGGYDVWVRNQRGEAVIEGTARLPG